MSDRGKKILHCVVALLLAGGAEALFILCLNYFIGRWDDRLVLAALIGGTVINAGLLAVDLCCIFLRKEAIYKTCLTAYIFLVIACGLIYVLQITGFLEIAGDEEKFRAFIEKSGKWMVPVFILLQFLQVVVLPIPSTVTVVAGAALFGPLLGSIYSLIGIILGSLVGFVVGRYAGYRVVAWLVGKDTLDKWLHKIAGKDKLLLSVMFLLPVFPDDVLCFVAGLSSMSLWYFLVLILISRIIAVFTTSYAITLIPFNTWWGILTWCILGILVILLFVVLYRKSDAILGWFAKKFRRETRVSMQEEKEDFTVEIVDPDGSVVTKGVKKGEKEKEEGGGS